MSTLRVYLFGTFRLELDGQLIPGLRTQKAEELFCYLLLHRDHAHIRESLAGLLWGERPTTQAKKYLRQALWQIKTALDPIDPSLSSSLLLVDDNRVQIDAGADIWLDTTILEEAHRSVQGIGGWQMDAGQSASVQAAVQLYDGDLLEGWYQDWCLFERERLQSIYLTLLEKLIDRCEVQHDYATGLAYGATILRFDHARERTHRRLMRLHYLSGDRTSALRQFEACVAALQQELDVKPSRRTRALYRQIRDDQMGPALDLLPEMALPETSAASLQEVLECLSQLQAALTSAQQQVQQDIQVVTRALASQI